MQIRVWQVVTATLVPITLVSWRTKQVIFIEAIICNVQKNWLQADKSNYIISNDEKFNCSKVLSKFQFFPQMK